LKQIFEAVQRC